MPFPHRAECCCGVSAGRPLVSEVTGSGCGAPATSRLAVFGLSRARTAFVQAARACGAGPRPRGTWGSGASPWHGVPGPTKPTACWAHESTSAVLSCVLLCTERRPPLPSEPSHLTLMLMPHFNTFFHLVSLKSGWCVDVIGSIFS